MLYGREAEKVQKEKGKMERDLGGARRCAMGVVRQAISSEIARKVSRRAKEKLERHGSHSLAKVVKPACASIADCLGILRESARLRNRSKL